MSCQTRFETRKVRPGVYETDIYLYLRQILLHSLRMAPRPSYGEIEPGIFASISHILLEAESDFKVSIRDICGVEEAGKAINKLRRIRANKRGQNIDSTEIDALLERSEENFRRSLRSLETESSPNVANIDIKDWVDELRAASRYHDPLYLSFDSDDDDVCDGVADILAPETSQEAISMISSRKFMKMSPIGKHTGGEGKHSTRTFNIIAISAWAFAIVCMLLALGFLTNEFVISQKKPAIRIEHVPVTEIELPAISVCNPNEGLPSFENYPTNDYPGHPLFLIAALANDHDDGLEPIHYPGTINSSVVEPIFRGNSTEKCKRDLSKMSIERSRNALFKYSAKKNETAVGFPVEKHPCQQCFRIGSSRRLKLSRTGPRSPFEMPVTVSVASSSVFGVCTLNHAKRNPSLTNFLSQEVRKHLPQLEERGIVDFKNPAMGTHEKRERLFQYSPQVVRHILQLMLCNVYFFSGYFYPSEDDGKVKFEWDEASGEWKPKGKHFTWVTHNETVVTNFSPNSSQTSGAFLGMGLDLFYEHHSRLAKREEPQLVDRLAGDSFIAGPSTAYVYFKRIDERDRDTIFQVDVDNTRISDEWTSLDRYLRSTVGKEAFFSSTCQLVSRAGGQLLSMC